jgi:hypothetical protein
MRVYFSISLMVILLCMFQSPAFGTVTTYNSRVTYQAAASPLGATTSIDFSTKDDGSSFTNPASDIQIAPLMLGGVSFDHVRSYYNRLIYWFPNETITASFPANTYAFGADMGPNYVLAGSFTVTLSSGEIYHTPVSSGALFFGVTSDQPLQWVKISYDATSFWIDNFTYTITPPPPPPVTAASIQRWSVTNGYYALNFFGDGTLLAAKGGAVPISGQPGSSGVNAIKLAPATGASIGTVVN